MFYMRRCIGGLSTWNRDYPSGSYGFMGNEKWHLAKALIDVTGICLVDDKQWIVYYRGTCVISATKGFRETAFRLSCSAVIVREYPCVSRACVSNANNHDSPSQLYGKLIPLDAVSADEERKANTVWYHLCGHVAGWRRDEEKERRRARKGEEVVLSSFDERTFPTDTQDLPFCCWFRGNESRRLCRPHPHFETWRSQNLEHRKRERSRLIIGNERCLVMWYEAEYRTM